MRIESSITSLSWIPKGAVEGVFRLPFELGVAHYDPSPPEVLGSLDELQATDSFRFVNRLQAWIEVQDGHIVDAARSAAAASTSPRSATARQHRIHPSRHADLRPEPEIGPNSVWFVQTVSGVVGFPTPAGSATTPTSRSGDQ